MMPEFVPPALPQRPRLKRQRNPKNRTLGFQITVEEYDAFLKKHSIPNPPCRGDVTKLLRRELKIGVQE